MMWKVSLPNAHRVLEEPGIQKALPRYVDIVKKTKQPQFQISKTIETEFTRRNTTEELWKEHDQQLEQYLDTREEADNTKHRKKQVNNSFLDLKALLGYRIMQNCHFCERRCQVDRFKGEKGYCKAGRNFSLYSIFPHVGEEPELVPSGTVFTGGCTIKCIHCQNWDISQWNTPGESVDPQNMAKRVQRLIVQGVRNLNMVGGDPTPVTWQWIETLKYLKKDTAVIWNSNSYYSEETARLLAGLIDLYLLDFKYGNNKCASGISDAPRYWETATRNLITAYKYGELLIRVLVLPEHNLCCTWPILRWIHDRLGPLTRVNLMFQYRPEWKASQRHEMSRRLRRSEIYEAREMAKEIGLTNLVN